MIHLFSNMWFGFWKPPNHLSFFSLQCMLVWKLCKLIGVDVSKLNDIQYDSLALVNLFLIKRKH